MTKTFRVVIRAEAIIDAPNEDYAMDLIREFLAESVSIEWEAVDLDDAEEIY
jgi:hypothetical protein